VIEARPHLPTSGLAVAALLYASVGWYVFPVRPRSKVPATEHGLLDASRDAGTVRVWWAATPHVNIGVDCGRAGLLVIDLDGPEAIGAWADLAARSATGGSAHEQTLVAETGTGLHLYFAVPDDADWARSTAGKLATGIDTRGAGGNVVAPPSRHPSGREYEWLNRSAPLAPAPAWLEELMRAARAPEHAAGLPGRLAPGEWATAYGESALVGICDEMLAAHEGERNDLLVRLAYRVGRLVAAGQIDRHVSERALVEAACIAGLPRQEATRTFMSGIEAGEQAGPALLRNADGGGYD
jgi:hypothetical protein